MIEFVVTIHGFSSGQSNGALFRLLAEFGMDRRSGGADALAQADRADETIDDLDIDQFRVDHLVATGGIPAHRQQPLLSVLVADGLSVGNLVNPVSIGCQPDGLAVGKPVCCEHLHCVFSSSARIGRCATSGSECRKLAPATASPMIVRTRPVRSSLSSSAG